MLRCSTWTKITVTCKSRTCFWLCDVISDISAGVPRCDSSPQSWLDRHEVYLGFIREVSNWVYWGVTVHCTEILVKGVCFSVSHLRNQDEMLLRMCRGVRRCDSSPEMFRQLATSSLCRRAASTQTPFEFLRTGCVRQMYVIVYSR